MKSPIVLTCHGNLNITDKYLKKISKPWYLDVLTKYGEEGVKALREATPVDTGKTAASWYYLIEKTPEGFSLTWSNSNLSEGDHGVPVVVLLYYGHTTKRGGYVEGRDFISPAIQPIFDKIATEAWKEMNE